MNVCGIIAEYNPFHNGHKYHIEETKRITGCDAVVVVMSGNFIQRGVPALFDKWTRTKMALESGADLVIELPLYYSISSAEYFAQGSISLLDGLNIVKHVSFGSNTTDLDALKRIANVLYLEPENYKKLLESELRRGTSFPIARSNALKNFLKKEYDAKYIADILLDSNNILAIEYLKALLYCNSSIKPIAIERKGGSYNSTTISDDHICSATAIRALLEKDDLKTVKDVVPEATFDILNKNIVNGKMPMFLRHFENEILYTLRKNSSQDLLNIADVTEGLENLLKKASCEGMELDSLIDIVKTKRYTRTRIQRILLHTLLDITKNDVEDYKYNPQYIRVLGFTKTGEKVLSTITNNSNLPVVTSVSKFLKNANDTSRKMLEKDILSTNIYTLGYQIPKYRNVNLDYTTPIVTV
ncbi:MAG: nucleotidyltransferase [Clostridia bacterium]|nr:nucleotidyltransferase [Clostridia bacterium]